MRYCMETGDLRLDRWVHHDGDMCFPVSHYHGITIGFFLDHAEKSVRDAMPGISVDLSALADKFCDKDGIYVLRKHPSIEHIFSELYNVPAKIRMDYFKKSEALNWAIDANTAANTNTELAFVPIMLLRSLTAKLIGVVVAVASAVFYLSGTMVRVAI